LGDKKTGGRKEKKVRGSSELHRILKTKGIGEGDGWRLGKGHGSPPPVKKVVLDATDMNEKGEGSSIGKLQNTSSQRKRELPEGIQKIRGSTRGEKEWYIQSEYKKNFTAVLLVLGTQKENNGGNIKGGLLRKESVTRTNLGLSMNISEHDPLSRNRLEACEGWKGKNTITRPRYTHNGYAQGKN